MLNVHCLQEKGKKFVIYDFRNYMTGIGKPKIENQRVKLATVCLQSYNTFIYLLITVHETATNNYIPNPVRGERPG